MGVPENVWSYLVVKSKMYYTIAHPFYFNSIHRVCEFSWCLSSFPLLFSSQLKGNYLESQPHFLLVTPIY